MSGELSWAFRRDLRKQSEDSEGYGSAGTPIRVVTNLFRVSVNPTLDIHQYEISLEPPTVAKNVEARREIFKIFKNQCGEALTGLPGSNDAQAAFPLAYDGDKQVFSAGPLVRENSEWDVHLDGAKKRKPIKVKLTHRATHSLRNLEPFVQRQSRDLDPPAVQTQILDVAMRASLFDKFATFKTLFFPDTNYKKSMSGGLIDWASGYNVHLRPGQGAWYCNINFTVQPMYRSGRLVSDMADFLGVREDDFRRGLQERDAQRIKSAFKGLKFAPTHIKKRAMKIRSFSRESAAELTFDKDGRQMSVVEYYNEVYNIKLQFPQLPCVESGSKEKPVYFPPELCTILPHQRYKGKIDGRQTAELIDMTSIPPRERLARITEAVSYVGGKDGGNYRNPIAAQFGFNIDTANSEVDARRLDPPTLIFGENSRNREQEMRTGQWNMQNQTLVRGATLESWGVLVMPSEREAPNNTTEQFVMELARMGANMGMRIVNPAPPIVRFNSHVTVAENLKVVYEDVLRDGQPPQFILVVLRDENSHVYANIKHVGDQLLNIPTQCVQLRKAYGGPRGINPQYLGNVILKINVKLGGTNFILRDDKVSVMRDLKSQRKNAMVVGVDLSHQAQGDRARLPSTASMCGTVDPAFSRYASSYRLQFNEKDVEVIQEVGSMMVELLEAYYQANEGRMPEHLIIYRDGMSEGQFAKVANFEIKQIKLACDIFMKERCGGAAIPRITYVVCQKRHQVRLFGRRDADMDTGKRPTGNLLHGTIVDKGICHPRFADFYLISQPGLKGTSRPTRYVILYDESGFGMDELQQLSYMLCFTFARATRGVGVVTPVYYAHLLAERARHHLVGRNIFPESHSTHSSDPSQMSSQRDEWIAMAHEHIMRSDVMIYI